MDSLIEAGHTYLFPFALIAPEKDSVLGMRAIYEAQVKRWLHSMVGTTMVVVCLIVMT
jgi:hypothetical protein